VAGIVKVLAIALLQAIAASFWRPGAAALFGNDPNYGFSASQV